jgi:hypothetical protein
MSKQKIIPLILVLVLLLALTLMFLPLKQAFTFSEYRVQHPKVHYIPLDEETKFQIRYVHSIHLSDVIESYERTNGEKIRLLSMDYEDVGIGMPGYAEEGETLTVKDGLYTLTYDNKVIDSFTMIVGDVDTDLAFRYKGIEVDLKQHLKRGESYVFSIKKISFYDRMRGEKMNG